MSIEVPPIVAAYFDADRSGSVERVAQCFTANAVVTDEGQVHTGREAIMKWKARSSQKYDYTVDLRSIAGDGQRAVVISRVTGNFPGSPIDLTYDFRLDGDAITSLEIKP